MVRDYIALYQAMGERPSDLVGTCTSPDQSKTARNTKTLRDLRYTSRHNSRLGTRRLRIERIADEISSHALVSTTDKTRVRVVPAADEWPVREVKRTLKGSERGTLPSIRQIQTL
jgi:hypothetical protein